MKTKLTTQITVGLVLMLSILALIQAKALDVINPDGTLYTGITRQRPL